MTKPDKADKIALTAGGGGRREFAVEWWPVGKPKPYYRNPRNNDEAVPVVAESIRRHGWQAPIVVDEDGVIIAGHTRLKAAIALGEAEVPVKVARGLTPAQVKSLRLADNRSGEIATWDEDALRLEIDEIYRLGDDLEGLALGEDDILEMLGASETAVKASTKTDTELDGVPEVKGSPVSRPGAIYALGAHRLLCGDATDPDQMSRLMAGESADLLLTDPPYNVDYGDRNQALNAADKANRVDRKILNDNMSSAEFRRFLDGAFRASANGLKPGGAFYMFYASKEVVNFTEMANAAGLAVKQQLVWVKSAATLGRQDYQWRHEPFLYGWKEGAGHAFFGDRKQSTVVDVFGDYIVMDGKRALLTLGGVTYSIDPKAIAVREPTDTVFWPKPQASELHPTMKPVGLWRYLIGNSSRHGEIVLDPFGGSGTTIIAAEVTGRKARSAELDPHYCDVIRKRWAEVAIGKDADWVAATPEETP